MTGLRHGSGGHHPVGAFADGLRRVKRAPWLVIGVWVSTVAIALPFAILLHEQIARHLGASMAAQAAADAVNFDWWNEFLAQTSGVGATFVPAIIGFAAVLKNVSIFADTTALPTVIALAGAMQLLVAMFLAGGVLDRLARDRAVGTGAFFAACGVYFVRFIRLGVIMAAVYWALFVPIHGWLFDTLYPALIAQVTVERTAFFIRLGLYAAFAAPVFFFNLLFDYAKVRAVVEDRRSMVGAVLAGWRFIRRQPLAAIGLYALNVLTFLLVAGLYFLVAPGASAPNVVAFAIGQLYIVLRVIVRLQFAASQVALFQGRLAHAGYVARPIPRWPDSPAAEAIGPR
ncbi:MAG TPA: hypothetical protein VEA16_17380 [Vicinamibacterales bacterium]|nr:hypothetical protein [Vicinamibacterales bacterium]